MKNRGSEWRKWDMHVHSPYTFLNKYKSTDDEFINKIKEHNISCIGLTNYFKFDIKEYELKKKLEGENIRTFLNLELRLDYQNKEDDCLDLHVIFSDKIDNIDKFLNNMSANISGTQKKLIDIESGDEFQKAVVNFDKLKECLNDESIGLKGEFLIGFLSRGKGNARTSTNYEKMAKEADLLIHSSDNENNVKADRDFWLLHNKPLLQNSDAHTLETIGKKYTWIKSDTTFEGFKQIIFEPEERISIEKEIPESDKLDNLIIEKITFTSSNDRFTPTPIYFNKNLNVIIGGKSSGKSILLYEIAKTLYSDTSDKVLKYTDTEDNYSIKDLYNLSYVSKEETDEIYNFNIHLFSESTQSLKDRTSQTSILPSIKYIPQNHLSNLVDKSRKNGATLKKIIRDLILESPEYKSKYDDFVAKAKKNDEERNQNIDYLYSLKSELTNKQKELLTKGDTKALTEGIIFNKKKVEELNKAFSSEEQTQYKELTDKIGQLKIIENKIDSDFKKIDDFQTDFKRFISEFHNKKKILLESIQTAEIKTEYSGKFEFIDIAFENSVTIAKDFISNEDENTSIFSSQKTKTSQEKILIETSLKQYNDKLENQKQVLALQKSIIEDEAKIEDIKQFKKEIDNNKEAIKKQREKIFEGFKSNFKLYENIIEDLKPRISDIQEETDKIEILPSIKYHFPKFIQLANNLFDGRGFNNIGFEYLYPTNNQKSSLSEVNYNEVEKSLNVIFERIEKKQLSPKGSHTEKDAVKRIFSDLFFDHWDVKSQGDDIHKMSTGKASFVLLKLIIKLSRENGPILIDQPEDNLDNRSVSKELVTFLKEKKKSRQIILVTHNPNIVVNADAENIIVANQKGQNNFKSTSAYQFDYINGSLENSFPKNSSTDLLKSMGVREHIAEIVEGGKDAFKKREEKYGFK